MAEEIMTSPTVSLGDAMLMCHNNNGANGWASQWNNPLTIR